MWQHKIQVLKYICIFTLLFLFLDLYSQKRFEHVTIEDGLSNNSISNIIQTQNGFLWFGTLNGLNRYDGKEIKSYTYEPGNKYSLSSNRIYYLFEDSLNYIWILTYNFQVLRFDQQTEKFINITQLFPHEKFQGRNRVQIESSSPSVFWIASEDGGIIRVKQKKGSDEFQFDFLDEGISMPSNKETFLFKDTKDRIWLGTRKGLMMLENDSVDLSRENTSNIHVIDTSHYFVNCIETEQGKLIFGTVADGVYEYNNGYFAQCNFLPDSTLKVRDIKPGKNGDFLISTEDKGLFHVNQNLKVTNYISPKVSSFYKIFCDRTGTFWIRTPLRGISMLNPNKKELKHFGLNSHLRESLGDSDKPKFLEDTKGNVWIGIYGGGLFKFQRETESFEHFSYHKENAFGLSSNFILTLFEDKSDNIWVGTFKGGLNKLNLSESKFQYKTLDKNASYKSQNEVRCITEDDKNRIWVGTKFGSIYCCDRNNNVLFKIPEDLANKDDYIRRNVYALLTDGNNLWIGTKGNGLYLIKDILDFEKYKSKSFEIVNYQHIEGDPNSISSNDVYSLLQDQYRQIWVGTYHGGLNLIKNPDSKISFAKYMSDVSDSTSLSDNRIRKIYKDRNNNLWIGTVNGLNYLDSKYLISENKPFRQFYKDLEEVNSLSNNDIFDIHQDLAGAIWVATYGGGLNKINIDSDTVQFKHYSRKDGLPSDIVFSILEDSHMNLWLGTDNGLGKFSANNYTCEIVDNDDGFGHGVFTEGCKYKSRNREFLLGMQNGLIRFNPDSITNNQKPYPIVFTGLKLFDENVLPGEEDSPLQVSIDKTDKLVLEHDQNFITINFAVMDFKSPDKIQYSYILENFEKKWNKTIGRSDANYKGIPPGQYIFKLKATDSNGIWMNEVRELSIIIKPPLWKTIWAYIAYLIILSVIFYLILREIRLRHEIVYENKLSEEKFKFFTSISHEFKTPLTLINNSVDDISKATTFTKDVRNGINLIKRNARNLNDLIEQLIDFRRLQKGQMDIHVRKVELISYLNDIYLTFLPYAEKKKLKFTFNTNIDYFEGWLDVRFTDKIINNLLSNAFKHTPSNKKVVFNIEISELKNKLLIQVQDQGEGINQENIDKIFNRFVFIENNQYSNFKSSGIGLSLVKEMVELHKGTISLNTKLNEGSTFSVEIPIGEDAYEELEKELSEEQIMVQQRKPFYSAIEDVDEEEIPATHQIKSSRAVKFKLLIIDDNQELREYLYNKLKKHYTVFIAVNGEEGVKMAEDVNPDLIITDLKMPLLDGIELTKHLKNNFETSHIPVILLTATSSMDSKLEGIDSGADDYITKPFHLEYLKKRIVNIINQRKQLKEKFGKEPGFKPEKLSVSNKDQNFLTQVIETIEANMKSSGYTIDSMIAELGFSRSVFFKKMKSVSGYAPKEFVRIVKMKKAAELLRDPDATIAEVSYNIGYSDPDYFSKSFKNFFGETPTSYQKKYK